MTHRRTWEAIPIFAVDVDKDRNLLSANPSTLISGNLSWTPVGYRPSANGQSRRWPSHGFSRLGVFQNVSARRKDYDLRKALGIERWRMPTVSKLRGEHKTSDMAVLVQKRLVGYAFKQQKWTLSRYYCALCSVSASYGSTRDFFSFLQPFTHMLREFVKGFFVLFQGVPLAVSEVCDSNCSQGHHEVANDFRSPITRRFILTWVAGLLLFPICRWSKVSENIYGRWAGRLLVGFGFTAFTLSLLLLCLTDFRWSWGWWL